MTYSEFQRAFQKEFELEDRPLSPDTTVFDELQFDSFEAFRLVIWLEIIADVVEPEAEIPMLFTLGDAYEQYVALRARPRQS